MPDELTGPILRGDILKILYYQGAFNARASVGSLMLWAALRDAGHHEGGAPLPRETLERAVDDLGARGLLRKIEPRIDRQFAAAHSLDRTPIDAGKGIGAERWLFRRPRRFLYRSRGAPAR